MVVDGFLTILEPSSSGAIGDGERAKGKWYDDGVDVLVHPETETLQRLPKDPLLRAYDVVEVLDTKAAVQVLEQEVEIDVGNTSFQI